MAKNKQKKKQKWAHNLTPAQWAEQLEYVCRCERRASGTGYSGVQIIFCYCLWKMHRWGAARISDLCGHVAECWDDTYIDYDMIKAMIEDKDINLVNFGNVEDCRVSHYHVDIHPLLHPRLVRAEKKLIMACQNFSLLAYYYLITWGNGAKGGWGNDVARAFSSEVMKLCDEMGGDSVMRMRKELADGTGLLLELPDERLDDKVELTEAPERRMAR